MKLQQSAQPSRRSQLIRDHRFLPCASLFCLWLLTIGPANAAGPIHGAKSSGMGTAFVATGDDPSVIAANPAGLVRSKGTHVYGGVTALTVGTKFIDPSGQEEKADFQVFFPPNLFVSSDFGLKDVVFGIGLYSPFGMGGRRWSETGLTRYVTTVSTIATFSAHPSVAWQVLPALSIGGGIHYMYAINRAERMLDQSLFGAGDGKMEVDADGDGWGYNVGVLWDLNEYASLGSAYRSKTKVHFDGTVTLENIAPPLQPLFGGARFETGTDTHITFPDVLSIGLALRPSNRLTVGIDGELVRWSSLDRSDYRFRNQVPEAGLSNGTSVHEWEDGWDLKFGLDYRMTESFSLRTGYVYVEKKVPAHTLGPGSPESEQHNFCFGAGYRKGNFTVDGFYIIGIVTDRTVNNEVLSGTYENQNHYVGVNFGKKF